MAQQQDTEEKSLPASWHKLREARRRGQVSQSRDFIAGATLCATMAYLLFAWPLIWGHVVEVVQVVSASQAVPFAEASARATYHAMVALVLVTAPLAGIVVAVTLTFGILVTRGLVFSAEPVKPKFQHINPAQGVKRIASLRNVIEFAKGLAKVVILATAFALVLSMWLQPLFDAPACGEPCLGPVLLAVAKPLAITAALAFLAIGLIDLPIQRWLFLRDMRMTRTEHKRERKSYEGDPFIRSELQRQRREAVKRTIRVGLRNAVLAVVHGDRIVGLRYVPGETPAPAVVARGKGAAGAAMIAQAREMGIPVFEDAELAARLYHGHRIGRPISPETFQPVARLLTRLGLV